MSGALKIHGPYSVQAPITSSALQIGTDPVAFGRLIHAESSGYRLLTSQQPRIDGSIGRPHHQFFRHNEWLSQIALVAGQPGYFYRFLSFRSPDKADTANLADLGALFQDLDWHSHPEASKRYENGEAVLAEVDWRCAAIGFPAPNLVVYSGRGLQVAWLHEATPASEHLKEWNAAQQSMCAYLADLGSDPRARPAVHFFKLPGQLNPKSGRRVAVIRQPMDASRFQFSDLFGKLFPEGLPTPKAKPARKAAQKPVRTVIDLAAARALRTGISTAQRAPDRLGADDSAAGNLIWAPRLRALRTIIEHRASEHGGCLPQGKRDGILFVTAVALSWITPDRWRDEYLEIAADYCSEWTAKEAMDRASAVAKRAGMLHAGESLDGEEPRYKMANETVREFADITSGEERLLGASAIAHRGIQKSARNARQAETRRATGRADREQVTGLDRDGYRDNRKAEAAEKAERARELRASGTKIQEIAEQLGCSDRRVKDYLKGEQIAKKGNGGTRCMLSSCLPSSLDSLVQPEPAQPSVAPTPEPAPINAELTNTLTILIEFTREMRLPGARPGYLPAVPRHLTGNPAIRAALTAAQTALKDASRRHRNRIAKLDAEDRQAEMRQHAAEGQAEGKKWFTAHLEAIRQDFDSRIAEADDRERGYLQIQKEAVLVGRGRAWKAACRHVRGLPLEQHRRRQEQPEGCAHSLVALPTLRPRLRSAAA